MFVLMLLKCLKFIRSMLGFYSDVSEDSLALSDVIFGTIVFRCIIMGLTLGFYEI